MALREGGLGESRVILCSGAAQARSLGVVTPEGYRIPTRYTHQQIVTMVGANRESVTRAFGRLQEEGRVELRERYIYIMNVEALKRASG